MEKISQTVVEVSNIASNWTGLIPVFDPRRGGMAIGLTVADSTFSSVAIDAVVDTVTTAESLAAELTTSSSTMAELSRPFNV